MDKNLELEMKLFHYFKGKESAGCFYIPSNSGYDEVHVNTAIKNLKKEVFT